MSDVFLCYRGHGAQTAKLFRRWMAERNFDEVWYSDDETCGNYKADIPELIGQARCAVLFITEDFFEGFSPENTGSVGQYQCITQLEIEEIEKNLQSGRDFRILTVYLDRGPMLPREELLLEAVFRSAGILTGDSVDHFSQSNQIPFSTRKDYEEQLFIQLQTAVLSQQDPARAALGSFAFGPWRTTVDLVQIDVKKPIYMGFTEYSQEIPFHKKVDRVQSDTYSERQNDQMISVAGWQCSRESGTDNMELTVFYKPVEYHLFHKCLQLWDSRMLKIGEKLARYDSADPDQVYEIPNAMGLALMVVTGDGYLVFSRRSRKRRIRSGEYDCSIVEGLRIQVEDESNGEYDIYDEDYVERECLRAYREEVSYRADGIRPLVNGLILDRQYGQWNIAGTILDCKTRAQLEQEHPFREDTYEKNQLIFVKPEELKEALEGFRRVGLWDTALAVLQLTLLRLGVDTETLFS